MDRWLAGGLMVALVLAGCVEAPASESDSAAETPPEAQAPESNETIEVQSVGPVGRLTATLDNVTVDAGTPFNVTLDYTGDNDTNASSLAWQVSFANNETGNATSYNGTGLPATFSVNLTEGGNTTMTGNASNGDGMVELEPTVLTVVAGSSDPCDAVPAQEPITISALFQAVAVDGNGLYQGHPFELTACQSSIVAEITSSEAYLDPMLRLKDNTGATVDEEDNEFLYHDTLTYAPGGFLEPGTWAIDARGYIGAPGYYTITLTFS